MLSDISITGIILDALYSLPAVFLAFSFHEFAHAFVADRLGDSTPRLQGRLTLDPLAHVDWLGLLLFLFAGFGWAKPVRVNPSNFRNRKWGDVLVSVAGPLANLFLAVVSTIIYFTLMKLSFGQSTNTVMVAISQIFLRIIRLNVVFSILNLIPIPPFDGYHILKDFLFHKNVKFFWTVEQYSTYILIACILLNVFDYLVGIPSAYIFGVLMGLGNLFF